MVNKKRLIALTRQLIRINSQNPGGDESRIAKFARGYLKKMGVEARIYEFKKDRSNLVAVLKAKDSRHALLVSPHLDTVPSGKSWAMNPFSAAIRKNRIYGLGATDCKGNLSAALEAINSIVEENAALDYNLIFAATADEETGSVLGLIPLLEKGILRPDAAIVLDADDFNIVIAQKGLAHIKVKLQGRRAHGAYPWRGINAIDAAVDIIKELKAQKFPHAKNKYLRPPTINIGTIKGGDKVNIVADWCEFELDLRFLPGMPAKALINRIRRIIRRHAKVFKIEIENLQEPYCISQKHPLVAGLKESMRAIRIKGRVTGSEGATVITLLGKKNIPAVACGFGCAGCAHAANEYIGITNLYRGALLLENFLKNYRFNN